MRDNSPSEESLKIETKRRKASRVKPKILKKVGKKNDSERNGKTGKESL